MNVGSAIASLGIASHDEAEILLVEINGHGPGAGGAGSVRHLWLADVAERDLDSFHDLYLASGAYPRDAISGNRGRTVDNARWVWWLPFDADLKDFLETDRASVLALGDAEIAAHCELLQTDLEEVFAALGLPLHRLDYTGHGLCAYVCLDDTAAPHVARLQGVHKAIVGRINALAGYRLVDPGVSDPGARITRVPGSWNYKAADAGLGPRRATRTIERREGRATAPELGRIAKGATRPPTRLTPAHAKGLANEDVDALVDALAPHWTAGGRHGLALALAGLLAKGGIPEEQTRSIIERLSAGDEETGDRIKAVASSYARLRSGLQTRGFMGLRETLPPDLLTWLDAKVQAVGAATRPRLMTHGRPDPATPPVLAAAPPPDTAAFGWFGDYVALMEPTTEAPTQFHLGVALTLAGALIGRRVRTDYASDPLYANLYTVLIGASGSSRKDTAIKRGLAVPQLQLGRDMIAAPYFLATDVSSAEGLISVLKAESNTLLYLTELSALLRNARRKGTTTILSRLIEAWDTPPVLQNLNKNSPQQAMNPFLSIIAATQPGILANEIADEDIHSGFANRWLYVPGVGKAAMALPPPMDKPAAWALYRRLTDAIRHYPEGKVLPLRPEAGDRWSAWYLAGTKQTGRDEDQDAMRIRLPTLAMKVALIFAVSEGANAIGDAHLAAAIALVDWMWEQVRDLLRLWGIGIESQIERRIETVLRKEGVLKRWMLQAKCSNRKWSSKDFAGVFEAMMRNGTLEVDPAGLVALTEGA